ncbi:MAG: DedA family protein, partial [Actinomycetota bacterium]|nr:DedA family protein [Actinomycetota bacterium]
MHSLGPDWMDPNFLLDRYGTALIWVSLAIVFIECGLLFPILPGDSLLFAIGLFIATGKLPINLGLALVLLFVAAFLGNVSGYEIGR